jgi:hypothetical protein
VFDEKYLYPLGVRVGDFKTAVKTILNGLQRESLPGAAVVLTTPEPLIDYPPLVPRCDAHGADAADTNDPADSPPIVELAALAATRRIPSWGEERRRHHGHDPAANG